MEKVRYGEMLPHEIVARRKKFPVAFIGLGGLEWHGEHLGVGGIDPRREATIEVGREACDRIVDGMVRKANDLLRRVDG